MTHQFKNKQNSLNLQTPMQRFLGTTNIFSRIQILLNSHYKGNKYVYRSLVVHSLFKGEQPQLLLPLTMMAIHSYFYINNKALLIKPFTS